MSSPSPSPAGGEPPPRKKQRLSPPPPPPPPVPVNIVLDTSVITNPHAIPDLRGGSEKTLNTILNAVSKKSRYVNIFMTSGCFTELKRMVNMGSIRPRSNMIHLKIRDPDNDRINVPGSFLMELISDYRSRGDAALKYATGELVKAYRTVPEERKRGSPDPIAPLVKRLRSGIRHHQREGTIDSAADINCIFLAMELARGSPSTYICTADQGIMNYVARLGGNINVLDPSLLLSLINKSCD
jgi:predicted DNA-binding protein (UPF0278 family)